MCLCGGDSGVRTGSAVQAGAGEVPRREDGLESLQAKSGSLKKDVLTTMTIALFCFGMFVFFLVTT